MYLPMGRPPPIYYYNKVNIKHMKNNKEAFEDMKTPNAIVAFIGGFLLGCFFTSMVVLFFKDHVPL